RLRSKRRSPEKVARVAVTTRTHFQCFQTLKEGVHNDPAITTGLNSFCRWLEGRDGDPVLLPEPLAQVDGPPANHRARGGLGRSRPSPPARHDVYRSDVTAAQVPCGRSAPQDHAR